MYEEVSTRNTLKIQISQLYEHHFFFWRSGFHISFLMSYSRFVIVDVWCWYHYMQNWYLSFLSNLECNFDILNSIFLHFNIVLYTQPVIPYLKFHIPILILVATIVLTYGRQRLNCLSKSLFCFPHSMKREDLTTNGDRLLLQLANLSFPSNTE